MANEDVELLGLSMQALAVQDLPPGVPLIYPPNPWENPISPSSLQVCPSTPPVSKPSCNSMSPQHTRYVPYSMSPRHLRRSSKTLHAVQTTKLTCYYSGKMRAN
eukprot:NODE_11595_length_444_cov_20.358255_g10940_i0.p1 GENE.NODE_11595_length_444_cov_20.358255_g10940_i0~~NODE_11595_length_444_cov_20.358255_g10940_i0.p1  ORF type:complete len:104 (+),score=3.94 NODE_11595_length_444_cov_20.358255_g10940_i0:57-368(+)